MLNVIILFILMDTSISFVSAQLRTNFFVRNLTLCPSEGPAKYGGNITTENKKQYLNYYLHSPVPIDENIGVSAQLRTNFFVRNLTFCPSEGAAKYGGNVTTENRKQYLNYYLHSPLPFDENIGGVCVIETVTQSGQVLPLFEIRENYYCKAMNKYLGEFWYDFKRAAQFSPGACPILAGRYNVHRYYMDFSKISLQTFPFGLLKFTFHAIDKKKNKLYNCLTAEVENYLN